MSKASRKYKEHHNTTLYEYRKYRRFLERTDREITRSMRILRNLHFRFFAENSWIPVERRNDYRYSPEFWEWCKKNVRAFYTIQNNSEKIV